MYTRHLPNLLGLFRIVATPALYILIALGTPTGGPTLAVAWRPADDAYGSATTMSKFNDAGQYMYHRVLLRVGAAGSTEPVPVRVRVASSTGATAEAPVNEWVAGGLPPLADGWSAPDYDLLAAGGDCLEAVMPWGGNALGQHYVVPVINWWGWNPQGHDWRALRARIYSIVFGESQVDAAMQFDDRLRELFGLFRYAYKSTDDTPFCPPRLKNPADRPAAHALLRQMAAALELFPIFRHAQLLRTWAGIVDVSPDASPIIGPTPIEGLFVNCGWGTGGFKATPGSGWVYADTIANGRPHPLAAPFSLERFVTGALVDEHGAAAVAH